MTEAKIIDGKAIAAGIRSNLKLSAMHILSSTGIPPKLAVIIVGDDSASKIYVRNKKRVALDTGIMSVDRQMSGNSTESEVISAVAEFNNDSSIHGILVQLPLPDHIDTSAVLQSIDPRKDVDCFHPENCGRLFLGIQNVSPCTPAGCIHLIKTVENNLSGMHAVVVGRSNIVGKPMAHLLLQENCTVTMAHSRTIDLASVTKKADILISAVGRPSMITEAHVDHNTVVIDVGIVRTENGITGDVDFQSVSQVARAITKVPGGVGPMTIAFLMHNTISLAARQLSVMDLPYHI